MAKTSKSAPVAVEPMPAPAAPPVNAASPVVLDAAAILEKANTYAAANGLPPQGPSPFPPGHVPIEERPLHELLRTLAGAVWSIAQPSIGYSRVANHGDDFFERAAQCCIDGEIEPMLRRLGEVNDPALRNEFASALHGVRTILEKALDNMLRNMEIDFGRKYVASDDDPSNRPKFVEVTDRYHDLLMKLADRLQSDRAFGAARLNAGRILECPRQLRLLKKDAPDRAAAKSRWDEIVAHVVDCYLDCIDSGVKAAFFHANIGAIGRGEELAYFEKLQHKVKVLWLPIKLIVGRSTDGGDLMSRVTLIGRSVDRIIDDGTRANPGIDKAMVGPCSASWKIEIEDDAEVCERLALALEQWSGVKPAEPEPVKPTTGTVEEDGDDMEVEHNGRVCRVKKPDWNADFTQVTWHGVKYTFTPGHQAEIVKLLWKEWGKKPGNGLSQVEIGKEIGSKQADTGRFTLMHQFRRGKKPEQGEKRKYTMHPAWETMIVSTGTRGCYMLAPHPIIE